MTQRDKWMKRPSVLKYHAFKDHCRLLNVTLPEDGYKVIFKIPMPKSWSKKKRAEMIAQPHRQKPDLDNLVKALNDSVHQDDSHVWNIHAMKEWSEIPMMIIVPI